MLVLQHVHILCFLLLAENSHDITVMLFLKHELGTNGTAAKIPSQSATAVVWLVNRVSACTVPAQRAADPLPVREAS